MAAFFVSPIKSFVIKEKQVLIFNLVLDKD